ncbi:hypothetical protein [Fictibacillus arsenicus]|uniref:Uncharacterized protein n=1 Tax=Fictibacillus arsenicus TaxID=255247 RepID=A0A1V3GB24_9BACL|nr:hypothetical protein [Fictibacillus arsenicus]OOE14040.1 hypothetical protein UN64_02165 [Fictibacillus arsenicus]
MNKRDIRFWEVPATFDEGFLKKKFHIEYEDTTYLHRTLYLEFTNLSVQGHGRMWMFVIKCDDYLENKIIYGEIVKEIHNLFIPFLQREYDYVPGVVLVDSEHNVYNQSS